MAIIIVPLKRNFSNPRRVNLVEFIPSAPKAEPRPASLLWRRIPAIRSIERTNCIYVIRVCMSYERKAYHLKLSSAMY